jgi:hypothetical protein
VDYFPAGTDYGPPPQITVTIDDDDLSVPVDLTYTFRSTEHPDVVLATITNTGETGATHTCVWTPDSLPDCLYTFDIVVTQPGDSGETTSYRSSMSVTSGSLTLLSVDDPDNPGLPPPLLLDSAYQGTAVRTYTLSEAPAPTSVTVALFNQALQPESSVAGLSDQVRDDANPVTLTFRYPDTTQALIQNYRAIITATDDRASSYPDHKPRRMLAWNATAAQVKVRMFLYYELTCARDSSLDVRWRTNPNDQYAWSSLATATSGDSSHWNDPRYEWWNGKGPIPFCYTIQSAPYVVGAHYHWDNPESTTAGMGLWEDGVWIGYKYIIGNRAGSDHVYGDEEAWSPQHAVLDPEYHDRTRMTEIPGVMYRHWLRIHPDGGSAEDPADRIGTNGCIGIRAGSCRHVENWITNIRSDTRGHFRSNFGPNQQGIPLWVDFPYLSVEAGAGIGNDYGSYQAVSRQ